MLVRLCRTHCVRFARLHAVALSLLAGSPALQAQNWSGATSSSFSTATNWDTLPTNDGTATVNFGSGATTNTVSVDANWSVAGINFTSGPTSGYQFNGANSAVLTVGSGGINDTNGHSINSSGGFTMALPSSITWNVSGGTDFANWALSGSGNITKTGAGTLSFGSGLADNLSWTGSFLINAGVLGINNDNKLGPVPASATPGAITLNGGALQVGGSTTISANRGIAVTAASTIQGTLSNTFSYGGIITGSADLTVKSGTLTLSGANTYSGTITLGSSGTLKISAANTLQNATIAATTGNVSFATTSATLGGLSGSRNISLAFSSSAVAFTVGNNNGSTTYSGVLSNTGSLIKTGTGTFTLSGNNSYSGITTVNAGTLAINGTPTGSGAFTVNSGGTLAGTGTVHGTTTINSGGTIFGGTGGAGTLTFNNGLNLNDGSALNFSLGTTSNGIRVSGGTLTGLGSAGSVLINFNDGGGFAPGTYTLLDYSSASVSNFDATSVSVGTGIAGYNYSFSVAGSQLQLTATSAIPEPSTYALVAGAAILVLALIRRRRLVAAAT